MKWHVLLILFFAGCSWTPGPNHPPAQTTTGNVASHPRPHTKLIVGSVLLGVGTVGVVAGAAWTPDAVDTGLVDAPSSEEWARAGIIAVGATLMGVGLFCIIMDAIEAPDATPPQSATRVTDARRRRSP